MSKVLVALLLVTACVPKERPAPAVDSTATVAPPAPVDTAALPPADSVMARDTAIQ